MRRRLRLVGLYVLLLAGAVVTAAPLAWMVSASLMPAGEASTFPPRFLPSTVTLEHYRALFTRLDVARYFLNSALIALSVTLQPREKTLTDAEIEAVSAKIVAAVNKATGGELRK